MNNVKNNTLIYTTSRMIILFLLLGFFLIISPVLVLAQEYIEYQIKEGDCLWTIARQFQLSIQEVAQANAIKTEQILSPGLLIKIPQNKVNHPPPNDNIPMIVHTVQKGESLWNIAQEYRLSLDDISSLNDLSKPDSLYIGQEIKIPVDKNSTPEKKTSQLSFENRESNIKGISTSLNQEFKDRISEIDYTVKAGESLWTIAQNYQVSLNDLSKVNDLKNAEKLSIGQIIKIPLGNKLSDEASGQKEKLPESWVEHIVAYGENISMIAQKYHLSIGDLCQLNEISQKDYVYPGQRLKIKASDAIENNVLAIAENNQQDIKNSPENTTSSEDESQSAYYIVKSGDTLSTIAQQYSVSMESILGVNYLTNKDILSIGQKLQIPAIGGLNQTENKMQIVDYTVAKGDTLWKIAQKFDVKMHEIISINQLENIMQLSIGQKLNIPTTSLAAGQSFTTSTAVTQSQSEEPKDVIHYVQKGESLWGISRKYDVSLQSIAKVNSLSENSRIIVGQKLVIPNVRSFSLSSRSFVWPLNGLITSHFGMRTLGGRRSYHTGIDIDGHTGTAIRAAGSGTVSFSGYINGYGKVVIIDHVGGYSSVYAHNSSNLVEKGQKVTKGDIIAKMGATGNATGSHLHFEIRENGKPVNPLNYLP